MSNMSWTSLLNSGYYNQTQVGVALANSTTITDISPGGNTGGQAFTFPASYLQAGLRFRVSASGIVSTTGTPNLTLGLYYGGVAGTALASTGAVATGSGLTNQVWEMSVRFRVESTGTAGSIRAIGVVSNVYASAAMMPATSSSGGLVSSLDTSTPKLLTIGATWGTASASNTIQIVAFDIEQLN